MTWALAWLCFGSGAFVTALLVWYFHDQAKARAIMKEAADHIEEQVKGGPKQ